MIRRSFLIYALGLLAGAACAWGECRYVRTKTRVESCKAVQLTPEELAAVAPTYEADEDPLMEDPGASRTPDDGRRVHLQCTCVYVLAGSDPRCDFDLEDRLEVRLVESDARAACRTAKTRCRDLCPTENSR